MRQGDFSEFTLCAKTCCSCSESFVTIALPKKVTLFSQFLQFSHIVRWFFESATLLLNQHFVLDPGYPDKNPDDPDFNFPFIVTSDGLLCNDSEICLNYIQY